MRVPTLIVYIISLSHGHRDDEEELCLRCRWVDGGTCASSSDASALYIRDGANVVQWKGSSLPSLHNALLLTSASSEKCLGWIRSGDSVRFFSLFLFIRSSSLAPRAPPSATSTACRTWRIQIDSGAPLGRTSGLRSLRRKKGGTQGNHSWIFYTFH